MVSIGNYVGREQSYVKHIFLERYLEALVHKTASKYFHIVYIDGFAGPWQSANERYQDTSFGIALNALRSAKASWKATRSVNMSAHLVERNDTAYQKLAQIPSHYPDISVTTYNDDFLEVIPTILKAVPNDAFTFFLIDPKGWRIPLRSLSKMLERSHSEIIFNFMFDFINRAASIKDPTVVAGLDELIPFGDWRAKLDNAEKASLGELTSEQRKSILVEAFGQSLAQLGKYKYVAETTVLRPVDDRPLYCLFYATRHPKGIEVFRDCQIRALKEQSRIRATTKLQHSQSKSGQREIFESLHDMAPAELTTFLENELRQAEKTLFELTPEYPGSIKYEALWPQVLARHVIRRPDVNQLATRLYRENKLSFPEWERNKRVPQPEYHCHRAKKILSL